MSSKGSLIVIEGTDGSGKTAQTKLLVEKLKSRGFSVTTFEFPRYNEPSSYFVTEYLNGRYGGVNDVSPKAAAMFFALDRFGAKADIAAALDDNKIVIINRYVASNMAHQAAKISAPVARTEFYKWVGQLEFNTLNIPRPNLNLILHVPAGIAQKLVDKKSKRDYITNGKRDIHEDDLDHLEKAEQAYLELAQQFPQFFDLVECTKNGKLASIEEVSGILWQKIAKKLEIEI